ncbi:MAG: tetratricopeptide repeat protein [Saprospiraceae bacterium]|nr:tetratricopeptide repeat protein [Saprospiraceae bacterium]
MENRYEHLLEAYFANTLNEAEKQEIKILLATDTEFAAEFAWQQSLARSIRTQTEKDPFDQKLKELERRFRFKRLILQITAIAASIALIIFAYLSIPPVAEPNKEQVLQNQQERMGKAEEPSIQPAPNTTTAPDANQAQEQAEKERQQAERMMQQQRRQQLENARQDSLLRQKMVANFEYFGNESEYNTAGSASDSKQLALIAFAIYNDILKGEDKHKEAVAAFKKLVAVSPDNSEFQFYYGIALLGNKQYKEAIEPFDKVSRDDNTNENYQTNAFYYLGMAHAGTGNYSKARAAFQKYLDMGGANKRFGKKASAMIEQLPDK